MTARKVLAEEVNLKKNGMKKILFFKNDRFLRVKLKNLRIIHVKFNVVCDCFEENHEYLAFFSCKIGKRRLLLVINGLKNSKKTVNL